VIGGVFAGIILTSIGVLFLLQNLGIHGFEDAWDYWPIILIALGVSRAASSYGWGGRLWGGTLVAVGTIFLLENLGWLPRVTWGRLWPLVIVALGISMLVKNLERQHRRDQAANVPSVGAGSGADPKAGAGPTIAGSSSGATSSSLLSEWAVFSGVRRRVDSQEFAGGEVTAVFGGAEIDLRGAGMTKEEVIIDVNAVFGGVEIYAPDTWEVVMRGAPIFGGYDDGTTLPRRVEGKKTPRLIIAGSAVFGGVSVKN
jgi:predicted membrane protein